MSGDQDKDAIIKQLQQGLEELRGELKTMKAENARLKRNATRAAAARSGRASNGKGKSSSTKTANGNGEQPKRKTVRAPSSRLYNPQKIFQKREKLLKKRLDSELQNCSFKPKTKAGKSGIMRSAKAATSRLFEQAKRQQRKRADLKQRKAELECQDCTFSPSIDEKSVKMVEESPDRAKAFERLSKPRVIVKNDMGLHEKDLLECTFTPKLINPQSSRSGNQVATHDRLYAEAILRQSKREQIRKAKEEQERAQELDGCTFSPVVNSNPEMLANKGESVVERLYARDVEARTERLERLKKNAEKEHSFKPKIAENTQYQTSSGNIIERLYENARSQDKPDYVDPECTFSPQITTLASKIDRGELPTHERLALEMSPSQKIALADMEDYYEDDEEYYDDEYYGEEGEEEEYEEGDMEEIDEEEEDDEEMELP